MAPFRLTLYSLAAVAAVVSLRSILAQSLPVPQPPEMAVGSMIPPHLNLNGTTDQEVLGFSHAAESTLMAGAFDRLELQASSLRDLTSRFPGGAPRLAAFYQALAAFHVEGCLCGKGFASDVERADKDRALNAWIMAQPDSITAKIAMARFLINVAWNTRGPQYAKDVEEAEMAGYQDRMVQMVQILKHLDPGLDAAIYNNLMSAVDGLGGGRDEMLALYKAASATFPSYYANYSKAANFLQQKWFGTADDLPGMFRTLAGRGDEISLTAYSFAAVGLAINQDAKTVFSEDGADWPTLRHAFEVREKLYGTSMTLLNMKFLMAVGANDHDYAAGLVQRIGLDWDRDVWSSGSEFARASSWARAPAAIQP